MDATGHYHETKTSFWIGLWDPELLRICEDIDLDDHPWTLLKCQWQHHVNKTEQVMEEAKKKDVIYLDDTSDEEFSDEESMKEMAKEVIRLVDSSNDENEKENVRNSKCFKNELSNLVI